MRTSSYLNVTECIRPIYFIYTVLKHYQVSTIFKKETLILAEKLNVL